MPDPSLTPGGGDATLVALISIVVTGLLGFAIKVGDVLVRWLAKRLNVPDERDEQLAELLRRLERLERERGQADE